ncbi:flagellar assembly protein T N-terminal domain-containing protein [Gallaecimonas mangrovi]|uniref:flagellar assembly protein T N-terminal domain-containing protein n=1 Tax=Gallaecimonas mangrovi TaxID=2291597 RepID=UPI000E20049F|nr:flagellar assembly protein T N-terminal domain-containing protein [Gallaecimonas mangrovi]
MKRCLLALFLVSNLANAAWYTGTGSAPIINGNKEMARQQASKAALRNAIIKAGASVSLVNEIDDGSLTKNAVQVRAKGHVNQIQRVEEYTKDDKIMVTLRADIWNGESVCDGHLTSKSVAVVPMTLEHPEQAAWGGLESMPAELSQHIFDQMNQAKADFLTKTLLHRPILVNPDQMSPDDQQALQSLAEQKQVQYIVMGQIDNMALGKIEGGLLSSDELVRQFGMTLYLIDGVSGLPILDKRYQTRTVWPFDMNARLGAESDQLWSSAYGMEITRLINTGIEDMSEALKCVHPKTRVIRVYGEHLDVAMGARQGVRVGDVFHLAHQYNYTDNQGVAYSNLNEENTEFEVVRVYPDHSQLAPLNGDMPQNVQIRDLVQLDSFWE